jgi:single-stranded DNA-binding protein
MPIQGSVDLQTNSVAITGRLTRDPTLSALAGEESAWELRVAVDGGPRDGEIAGGRLHCLDVTVRGRGGESAARELGEGSEVAIQGHLEAHDARGEVATTRPAVGIVADRVECLGSPATANRASHGPDTANVHRPAEPESLTTFTRLAEPETLTTFTRLADIPFDG